MDTGRNARRGTPLFIAGHQALSRTWRRTTIVLDPRDRPTSHAIPATALFLGRPQRPAWAHRALKVSCVGPFRTGLGSRTERAAPAGAASRPAYADLSESPVGYPARLHRPRRRLAEDHPHPAVIRVLALAAGLTLVAASAGAQIACLPPEESYPYEPPRDDPELRAIINEQYETYVLEVEEYINCLRREADLASTQAPRGHRPLGPLVRPGCRCSVRA